MADMGESSSTALNSTSEKPVVIRVKRKSYHSRLDAFWLEINERPLKRALLDFQKLSVTDAESKVEELKTKKVFVQHVETVSNSDAIIDVLQSFVVPSSSSAVEVIPKGEERKPSLKKDSKQEQLLSKARQSKEVSAQNARFEQIWRRRRGNKEASQDKALHDMCHFYDIVRVDVEGQSSEMQEQEVMSLEDQELLSSFLPLLREFIPSAAADIESDMSGNISKPASADDYVYDYYTARDDIDMDDGDSLCPFPLVQVEDEDFYDGPDDESDYESDDSNAEHHPWNEYPDEEESGTSSNESEEDDDRSSRSSEIEERLHGRSKVGVPSRGGGIDDDDDGNDTFDDYEDDDNFECGDDDEDSR
ncbi:RNA-directed DNA methylation 4 isoform X2 [Mercurialis annua]|uniref:RNA-directed DNA methylation 4 isoform X2 n=1 Tax=Mercurialis annua TaxID=3986 RepID=UPI00215F47A2|nr:RNA-directed DNA methylation 4 isoform X2 [Mercurialis annua]